VEVPTNNDKDPKFEMLLEYLKRTRGFDFTAYKRSSLMRRVCRRMQLVGLEDFSDYVDYLEVHPDEFTLLFNTILINVTAFWRDAPAWQYLYEEIIPKIGQSNGGDGQIRVWSAGCSSGEEAYTLAMALAESLGLEAFSRRIKIYATDADEDALTQARQGSYSARDLLPLPAEMRDKYFEPNGERFLFRSDLRRSLIFGRHDLVQDAPISRLGLLVCRNTLMYFNAQIQDKILARFHFALKDTGFLFLGKAEMLLARTGLFEPLDLRHRVFFKAERENLRDRLTLLAEAGDREALGHLNQRVRLRELAFGSGLSG